MDTAATVQTIEQRLAAIEAELQEHGACCPSRHCRHRKLLQTTLLDVICTLEETRQAFKSKQLETLRKSLIRILAEDLENDEV